MDEPTEVLTAAEAAKFYRVSPDTLRAMTERGEVPAFRVGARWRYLRHELEADAQRKATANLRKPEAAR